MSLSASNRGDDRGRYLRPASHRIDEDDDDDADEAIVTLEYALPSVRFSASFGVVEPERDQ